MSASYLALYEAIGDASRRMRDAARDLQWDALVEAEAACAELVARARTMPAPSLDVDASRRRHAIIRGILADDAEIRDRVQPRLAELEVLLAGSERGRRARRDYGG